MTANRFLIRLISFRLSVVRCDAMWSQFKSPVSCFFPFDFDSLDMQLDCDFPTEVSSRHVCSLAEI